jgi:hypothetical protein
VKKYCEMSLNFILTPNASLASAANSAPEVSFGPEDVLAIIDNVQVGAYETL